MKNPTLYWIIGAIVVLAIIYFFFLNKGRQSPTVEFGGTESDLDFLDAAGKKAFWDSVKWLQNQPADVEGSWKQRIVATAKEKGRTVNREIYLAVLWVKRDERGIPQ